MSAQGVLDVLNRAAELHGKIHGNTDAVEAVALVSELIAADKEFDEARSLANDMRRTEVVQCVADFNRYNAATARRASALAALEQQS